MEDFEKQLRDALARKDAPEWFEARVMAACLRDEEIPVRKQWVWRSAVLRFVSAMAVVLVIIGGVAWQHERAVRERALGEAAKARLELALRITSIKLHKIEQKLNEVERND